MLVKRMKTTRGRKLSDESGSTLIVVLIVMLVLAVGATALAGMVINTTGSVATSRDRAQAQAAVDAGIAAQTARLESGDLPCADTSKADVPVIEGTASPKYKFTLTCTGSSATLTVNASVANAEASHQTVFSVASATPPPTAGGPGLFYTYGMTTRMNSFVFDAANSEVGIDDFVGSGGVYASTGKIECGTDSIFPSDIYTKSGSMQIDTGCVVKGNAYIGGHANLNGGTIEGSLVAPSVEEHRIAGTVGRAGSTDGNVIFGGTLNLNGGKVFGSVTAAGSGKSTLDTGTVSGDFRYKGSYGVGGTAASSIVKGNIIKDGTLTATPLPTIPGWQDVSFVPVSKTQPPKAWVDAGYKLITVEGDACKKWSTYTADITSVTGALSGRTIFDVRPCANDLETNSGGSKDFGVNQDVAVIADKWNLSGTNFKSLDGKPHTVFLITPDGNPAAAGPDCKLPAEGSQLVNGSMNDKKIAVYIYTPCQMKFNGGYLRGQVYSGNMNFGGGVTIAFAPRNIPGYDFGKDTAPMPGSGGSGGAKTFSVVSSRDLK